MHTEESGASRAQVDTWLAQYPIDLCIQLTQTRNSQDVKECLAYSSSSVDICWVGGSNLSGNSTEEPCTAQHTQHIQHTTAQHTQHRSRQERQESEAELRHGSPIMNAPMICPSWYDHRFQLHVLGGVCFWIKYIERLDTFPRRI